MNTWKENPIEQSPSHEVVIPINQADTDKIPASHGRGIRNTIARVGALAAIGGAAYVVGLFTAHSLEEQDVESDKTTFNVDKIFMEQQGVAVAEVPDPLARASTVQIKTMCEGDQETIIASQGTGAIFRTANGELAVGTATHVVTQQSDSGLWQESACWITASVDTGDETLNIPLLESDFQGTFYRPTLLRAVQDQPAMAVLTSEAAAELETAVDDGLLMPLTINRRATEKSVMIIRQGESAGPMSGFDEPQATYIDVVGAKDELLKYNTNRESNVCRGNSGAPVLRIHNNRITNESFAVVSTARFIHLEVGVEEMDTNCAQLGTLVSYQVVR